MMDSYSTVVDPLRLREYDYAERGAYFVTIVTQDRSCLFGEIINDAMQLSGAGVAIQRWWFELKNKFATVETDEFVIMPNHLHGIVVITDAVVGADLRVGPVPEGAHTGAPLPTVIQWSKTMTTNEYIRSVKTLDWPAFRARLWQRNYYEHVIRNDDSLLRIREYILDNPARRAFDRKNPAATAPEPENAWRI